MLDQDMPYSKDQIKKLIQSKDFYYTLDDVHPKIHSKNIDKILEYNIEQVENSLTSNSKPTDYNSQNVWIGLEPEILQTPYSEIANIFEKLEEQDINHITDLGAAYGRMGFVKRAFFPEAYFKGYEIVKERAQEGNRILRKWGLSKSSISAQNVLTEDLNIEDTDLIFIYDFSDPQNLKKVLTTIADTFMTKRTFLVAKGKGVRSLIQTKFPEFHSAYPPFHTQNWSIYSSFVTL